MLALEEQREGEMAEKCWKEFQSLRRKEGRSRADVKIDEPLKREDKDQEKSRESKVVQLAVEQSGKHYIYDRSGSDAYQPSSSETFKCQKRKRRRSESFCPDDTAVEHLRERQGRRRKMRRKKKDSDYMYSDMTDSSSVIHQLSVMQISSGTEEEISLSDIQVRKRKKKIDKLKMERTVLGRGRREKKEEREGKSGQE
jgi:hypothetical protein